jgi:PhnB protein
MQLYPNLSFDGRCEAAFRFYEKCLHGKISFMMIYENSPQASQLSPDWRKKIFHATFAVGDFLLSGADLMPEQYRKPQGFTLQLNLSDHAEAERIFNALAAGGTVTMQLQETPWASRFGALTDPFGIPWVINCE